MNRRFQVFISSTYEDLKAERQAAVEAILKSGHIPAGMELFTAGDKSQMDVIRRWIDESDVFMLILGARYGSIEPSTGKSYVELEFEYALEVGKPFFSVVMSDDGREAKVKERGTSVIETTNQDAYRRFRERVLSNLCAHFNEPRDVKIAVFETIPKITDRNDLTGWVSTSDIQSSDAIAKELARVSQENARLRDEVELLQDRIRSAVSSGPGYAELYEALNCTTVTLPKAISGRPEDFELTLLNAAISFAATLARSVTNAYNVGELESFVFYKIASPLAAYGLVDHGKTPTGARWQRLKLSKEGTRFFARAQIDMHKRKEDLDNAAVKRRTRASPRPADGAAKTKSRRSKHRGAQAGRHRKPKM